MFQICQRQNRPKISRIAHQNAFKPFLGNRDLALYHIKCRQCRHRRHIDRVGRHGQIETLSRRRRVFHLQQNLASHEVRQGLACQLALKAVYRFQSAPKITFTTQCADQAQIRIGALVPLSQLLKLVETQLRIASGNLCQRQCRARSRVGGVGSGSQLIQALRLGWITDLNISFGRQCQGFRQRPRLIQQGLERVQGFERLALAQLGFSQDVARKNQLGKNIEGARQANLGIQQCP